MTRRRDPRDELEEKVERLRARLRSITRLIPGKRPGSVVIDLSGAYPARTPRRPFFGLPLPAELGLRQMSLEELRHDLEAVSDTRWIKSVVFRVGTLRVPRLASAYGLRQAVAAVRKAGKKTTALLQELNSVSYYVGSAAETVIAPESAEVSLHGIALTAVFLRDALDRHGVKFEKLAIDEYKNAFDELTRQSMSGPHREQYEALLESLYAQWIEEVATSRRLKPEALRTAIDEGITSASRARELGLIDRVAYEDEIIGKEHAPFGDAERFLPMRRPAGARRVAVVSLLGTIVPGQSRRSPTPVPLIGGVMAGSETVVRCLRAAAEDSATAAIVLHVDSGGGSPLASDLIWREVKRIRATKPVVAVMEGVAASGGYYVLAHANHVVAAPTTITGSIGVLTGKLVLDGFFAKHGISVETVQRGRFALLNFPTQPFTEQDKALLERANREVYDRFVSRVAEGRRLTRERVNEIGRGHVWSGVDALRHGLVDELGDVQAAIDRACDLAKIPRGAPTWNVRAPTQVLLPTASDPTTLLRAIEPLLRETTLVLAPPWVLSSV
jgi:protease-4